MGYATREQMKKTAETLSQGNDTINISAGQMAPEITTPDVSELDGGVLHELDANQTLGSYSSSSWTPPGSSIARLNQISHTSNGSLSIASAVDSLYANPTDDTSRRTEPSTHPLHTSLAHDRLSRVIQNLRNPPLDYTSLPSLHLRQPLHLHTTTALDILRAIYLIALDALDLRLLTETLHAHEASPASSPRIRCQGKQQRPPRLYPSRQYKTLNTHPQLFRHRFLLQKSRPLHEYPVCHTRSLLWMPSRRAYR
jgi:hypothetical protein